MTAPHKTSTMRFSLLELAPVFADNATAAKFLQKRLLFNITQKYEACHTEVSCQSHARSLDGIVFRCTRCKRCKSIRTGTYWEGSKLDARSIILLLYFWANKATNAQLSEYLDLSPRSCVDCLNFVPEICSWKMAHESTLPRRRIKIVQIDESVVYKPKYHLGGGFKVPAKWIT